MYNSQTNDIRRHIQSQLFKQLPIFCSFLCSFVLVFQLFLRRQNLQRKGKYVKHLSYFTTMHLYSLQSPVTPNAKNCIVSLNKTKEATAIQKRKNNTRSSSRKHRRHTCAVAWRIFVKSSFISSTDCSSIFSGSSKALTIAFIYD